MTTPVSYVQDFLNSKMTNATLTIALLVVAFALVYIALFMGNEVLKAGTLAWVLLP